MGGVKRARFILDLPAVHLGIAAGVRKVEKMEKLRGVLMLAAAVLAGWKAWKISSGPYHWGACALVVLALGMAAWHLTRKPQPRRPR